MCLANHIGTSQVCETSWRLLRKIKREGKKDNRVGRKGVGKEERERARKQCL